MTMLADLHHLTAAEFAEAIAPLQSMFDAHHSRLAARKREPFRTALNMHDAFSDKYIPEPNTGCYLWIGTLDEYGYGRFSIHHGTWKRAHRVAWEIYKGEIPSGMHVCHKCDTRCCVNPEHLFLGTNADNTQDKTSKNRVPHGVNHWSARLTESDVIEIFNASEKYVEISKRYRISVTQVGYIKQKKSWKRLLNSPATASPSRDALDFPLDRAVAGDSSLEQAA